MTKFYYREQYTAIIEQFSVIEADSIESAERQLEEGFGRHLGHSIIGQVDHDEAITEVTVDPPAIVEYDAGPSRVVVYTEGGVVTGVEGNEPIEYLVVDLDELSDAGDVGEQEALNAAAKWLAEAPARKVRETLSEGSGNA